MRTKEWTAEEVERLRVLRCEKAWSCPAIGAVLGRSDNSVYNKCERMGFSLPGGVSRGAMNARNLLQNEILIEAFKTGAEMKGLARSIGVSINAINRAFSMYADQMTFGKDEYVPGPYIGHKEMMRIVSPILGVPVQAIAGPSRRRAAVLARMAVSQALRDRGMSLGVIGRFTGRGDHTTVINTLRRFPDYVRHYPELAMAYSAIKKAEREGAERLAA